MKINIILIINKNIPDSDIRVCTSYNKIKSAHIHIPHMDSV